MSALDSPVHLSQMAVEVCNVQGVGCWDQDLNSCHRGPETSSITSSNNKTVIRELHLGWVPANVSNLQVLVLHSNIHPPIELQTAG